MRKVAIVGSEEATRGNAPWNDPSFEIWVMNEAAQADWVKRWDSVFQLHLPEVYRGRNHVRSNHWEWLQQDHGDKVIYMQAQDDLVPNCRVYPLETIKAMTPDKMLTSTAAMLLAFAILKAYDEIHIWGISLVSNSEYSYQIEGWLYWVGFARGVSYINGNETKLILHSGEREHFQNRLYGYEGDPRLTDFYQQRIGLLEQEYRSQDIRLRRIDKIISDGILNHRYDNVAAGIYDLEKAAIECGAAAGALGEAETYLKYGNEFIPRQEIERHMAKAQQEGDPLKALMHNAGGKCEYVWNVWRTTGRIEAASQLRKFVAEKRKYAYDCGAMLGIYQENLLYMQEYDERITALGGDRALKQVEMAYAN